MGLRTTQLMGALLDGAMRHTPEALAFVALAADKGVPAAVAERDRPFGDYSQERAAAARSTPRTRNGPRGGARKPRRNQSA
jgi:enoyl-CoA hydratase